MKLHVWHKLFLCESLGVRTASIFSSVLQYSMWPVRDGGGSWVVSMQSWWDLKYLISLKIYILIWKIKISVNKSSASTSAPLSSTPPLSKAVESLHPVVKQIRASNPLRQRSGTHPKSGVPVCYRSWCTSYGCHAKNFKESFPKEIFVCICVWLFYFVWSKSTFKFNFSD